MAEGAQPIRFVVCEDGSTDNTVQVLEDLARQLPLLLISDTERKGYSRAVIDGFRKSTSNWVAFIDSDGQCDPADFASLLSLREKGDLIVGWRNPRSDHWIRLAMSGAFRLVYRTLFSVPARDPSCPYLLIRKSALEQILSGKIGILRQGFWWEFLARAAAHRIRIVQTPVKHRVRTSGVTQVYRASKVPRIAFEHLLGLCHLKRELNGLP
jgi:dolichol-phosphate mannosyltransferase